MGSGTTVSIYHTDVSELKDPALFRAYYGQMPEYRQRKIDALRFEKDKRLSLGAGILLQAALQGAELKEPADGPTLGEHGKPRFDGLPAFRFSLSHSGRKVLCAVCEREIGCDVQQLGEYNEKLAKRFFHPDEIAALLAAETEEQKRALFYRLWVLKESYIKATGYGLSLPLSSFSVTFDGAAIRLSQAADPRSYALYDFSLDPEYSCACCVQEPTEPTGIILRPVPLAE